MKKTVSLLMAGLMVCGATALAGCKKDAQKAETETSGTAQTVTYRTAQTAIMRSVVDFLNNHNAETFEAIGFVIELEGEMSNKTIVDLTEGENETEDEVVENSIHKSTATTYVSQDLIKIEEKTEETGVEYEYDDEKKCDYKIEYTENETSTTYLQKGTKTIGETEVEGYWAWMVDTTTRTENGGEPVTETDKYVYFYTGNSKFVEVVYNIIEYQFQNTVGGFLEHASEEEDLYEITKTGDVYTINAAMFDWQDSHSTGSLTYDTQDFVAEMKFDVKDITKSSVKMEGELHFGKTSIDIDMSFGFTAFGEDKQNAVKAEIGEFKIEDFEEYSFYFDFPSFEIGL